MADVRVIRGDTWQRAWVITDGAGEPVDLITKIIAKADAMAALEAQIAGTCGRHQDAVRAAADPSAYDWSTDWPVVA